MKISGKVCKMNGITTKTNNDAHGHGRLTHDESDYGSKYAALYF